MKITLDAASWTTKDDFFNSYSLATMPFGAFGMNLDALADSFRGGICKITPDAIQVTNMPDRFRTASFWKDVEQICEEAEIVLVVH